MNTNLAVTSAETATKLAVDTMVVITKVTFGFIFV
jgi:hypothetical protein